MKARTLLLGCSTCLFVLLLTVAGQAQLETLNHNTINKLTPRPATEELNKQTLPQVNEGQGEAAGGVVRRQSTTICGPGNLRKTLDTWFQINGLGGSAATTTAAHHFGTDIQVKTGPDSTVEHSPSLACDSQGNYYLAYEDSYLGRRYIQFFKSTDSGLNWSAFGYITSLTADLIQPSITVGEGFTDRMIAAYIVDDGALPYPEVATSPLSSHAITTHSVPLWLWEGYAKPVVWTDSISFDGYNVYLTCEGIVDSAAENINVCAWRSINYGVTWGNSQVALGNFDTEAWIDPDGDYGTHLRRDYIVCYNDTTNTVSLVYSDNFGNAYSDPPMALASINPEPNHAVDPEIAAAPQSGSGVMVAGTRYVDGSDAIGYTYSTDGGDTWTSFYLMPGMIEWDEYAVALHANPSGRNWHMAYTREDFKVLYNRRPQDFSELWQTSPDWVNDSLHGSGTLSKKGIASHWSQVNCGVVWADFRDLSADYDIYFDYTRDGILTVPEGYATIQEAILAAEDGDEIRVGPGTYEENVNFLGKLVMLRSTHGAPATVIDGMQNSSCILCMNGETMDTEIEGFTLTNGNASYGGGAYCSGGAPALRNCVIVNNQALHGGGIYCASGQPRISCCTIYGNTATGNGGGLYCGNPTAEPIHVNSIYWNNNAAIDPEVHVASGTPVFHACDIQGGFVGVGGNNIDDDPLFADPAGHDFHLTWLSPCINRGLAILYPETDYDGDPRNCMGTPDMGADEFVDGHAFSADSFTLSVTGGTVNLDLFAGLNNIGRVYLILGSLSNSSPGTPLPGGLKTLPINWDNFTDQVLRLVNQPPFFDFLGVIDHKGWSPATLSVGALNPNKIGKKMTYAYCLEGTPDWDFASNPVVIEFVP